MGVKTGASIPMPLPPVFMSRGQSAASCSTPARSPEDPFAQTQRGECQREAPHDLSRVGRRSAKQTETGAEPHAKSAIGRQPQTVAEPSAEDSRKPSHRTAMPTAIAIVTANAACRVSSTGSFNSFVK